jgi:hypothetical protein
MKLTPWYLAALAPIAIAGCSGALLGHVAVLAVAIGIFVGTLSLGRAHASGDASGVGASRNVASEVHAKGVKTV